MCLSSHYVDSGGETQEVKLGGKRLDQISHLTNPEPRVLTQISSNKGPRKSKSLPLTQSSFSLTPQHIFFPVLLFIHLPFVPSLYPALSVLWLTY